MNTYKRITIIGNTASGKSTLSVLLANKLSIPVYHLDKYLWRPGWERVPEEEFTAEHEKIVSQDSWIIEGVAYFSTMKKRLESADLIIYFDLPVEVCKKRALLRMQEEKIRSNPYTNGCPYDETPENIVAQNKVIEGFVENKKNLDPLIDSLQVDIRLIYIHDEVESEVLADQILKKIEEYCN